MIAGDSPVCRRRLRRRDRRRLLAVLRSPHPARRKEADRQDRCEPRGPQDRPAPGAGALLVRNSSARRSVTRATCHPIDRSARAVAHDRRRFRRWDRAGREERLPRTPPSPLRAPSAPRPPGRVPARHRLHLPDRAAAPPHLRLTDREARRTTAEGPYSPALLPRVPVRRDRYQRVGERLDRLVAILHPQRHPAVDHLLQPRRPRDVRIGLGQSLGLPREARLQYLARSLRVERRRPREHAEEDERERVEVAPPIERLSRELLGAHVFRGPDHQPGPGHLLVGGIHHPRHAEVDDLDEVAPVAVAPEHHIVGLEVAMDDLEVVRRGQRARDLRRDRHRPERRHRPLARQERPQRLAVHVLHRQEDQPLATLAEVVDLHHVGVRDTRRVRCLTIEAEDRIGSETSPSRITLRAQRRPMRTCSARKTCPIPPFPSSLCIEEALGDHLPDHRASRIDELERAPVARAEQRAPVVLGAALQADFRSVHGEPRSESRHLTWNRHGYNIQSFIAGRSA